MTRRKTAATKPERSGFVLDAGAFIALERRDETMTELVRRFTTENTPLCTSAGVVAQIWRGGARDQAPLVYLLRKTVVHDLTHPVARVLGRMLAERRTSDPIDAHVVLLARQRGWFVITSDPDDLLALDPEVRVERI